MRSKPFISGLTESEVQAFGMDVLKYKDKYHQISDQRIPYRWDKGYNPPNLSICKGYGGFLMPFSLIFSLYRFKMFLIKPSILAALSRWSCSVKCA